MYAAKNLLPTEQIVYTTRLHWIVYALPIVLFVSGAAIVLISLTNVDHDTDNSKVWMLIGLFFIGLSLYSLLKRIAFSMTSEFVITNKRILIKVGVLRRHSFELLINQVEGVGVDQGVIGRTLRYGTITISGSGGSKEIFPNIENPLEFRKQVQLLI